MFKFVLLSALIAIAAANPGLLASPGIIAGPLLGNTQPLLGNTVIAGSPLISQPLLGRTIIAGSPLISQPLLGRRTVIAGQIPIVNDVPLPIAKTLGTGHILSGDRIGW